MTNPKIELTQEQVAAVAAQLAGAPPKAAEVYPQTKVIDGCKVNLKAEINPAWQTGGFAKNWYNPSTGLVMPEPSNATGDQPLRTAAGWPIVYAPGTNPSVMYDGHAFNSDAEVAEYRKTVAETLAANLAAGEQEFLSRRAASGGGSETI